jgi:urea transport system substrate-binding protein
VDKIEKKKILIVEDDLEISFTLKIFLEGEGYQVMMADNGAKALELLRQERAPDLILLDMKMPVMNGWQFALEFLNQFDHLSPIVVFTAAADAEKRANEINAIGWIAKPFDLDELLALIKKHEKKSKSI